MTLDINVKNEKIKKQFEFLLEIDKLKQIFRQSLLTDGTRHENDAEHSWHLCMYAMVLEEYAPEGCDILKAIKLMLIHDLVEIYAGDVYLYDEQANVGKFERENEAADKLYSLLPSEQGDYIKKLWLEFEKCETSCAKFANTLDRLQPIMLNYITEGRMWLKNGVHKKQVVERCHRATKEANPEIVDFIMAVIDDAVEKGYLLP
jgi:putative hydrolase of HD superfamily